MCLSAGNGKPATGRLELDRQWRSRLDQSIFTSVWSANQLCFPVDGHDRSANFVCANCQLLAFVTALWHHELCLDGSCLFAQPNARPAWHDGTGEQRDVCLDAGLCVGDAPVVGRPLCKSKRLDSQSQEADAAGIRPRRLCRLGEWNDVQLPGGPAGQHECRASLGPTVGLDLECLGGALFAVDWVRWVFGQVDDGRIQLDNRSSIYFAHVDLVAVSNAFL